MSVNYSEKKREVYAVEIIPTNYATIASDFSVTVNEYSPAYKTANGNDADGFIEHANYKLEFQTGNYIVDYLDGNNPSILVSAVFSETNEPIAPGGSGISENDAIAFAIAL